MNGTKLEAPTTNSNLALDTYTYEAKSYTGYTTMDTTKLVMLTALDKDQTIIFRYTSIIPPVIVPHTITVLPQTGDNANTDYTPLFLMLILGTLSLVLKKKKA